MIPKQEYTREFRELVVKLVMKGQGIAALASELALIRTIDAELKAAYGSPRTVKELHQRGFPASKPRVERLMRENGFGHATRGVTRRTTPFGRRKTK